MNFVIRMTAEATEIFSRLENEALVSFQNQNNQGKSKASQQEGLYKQIVKTLQFLAQNPKHPGLHTHQYSRIDNPFHQSQKVFEAYAQNNTPGADRVFWCYGPNKSEITIVTITAHPYTEPKMVSDGSNIHVYAGDETRNPNQLTRKTFMTSSPK